MPYASNSDLPQNIRDKYGDCASAFRGAFNAIYDRTGDEGRAFAAAHSAAQRCQRKESSMALVPAARLSPDIKAPRFNIVTKALSGETDEGGRRRFRATASSTITDRDGDEITLAALQQMATKFRDGVTIFTDHDNKVANAFGTTDTAEIIQRGQDAKTGQPIWDLDIAGTVNEPNPNAVQLHDSITGGYVKLGCSIDAFVLKHAPKQAGRYKVEDIDVFAASIVGVPANQRSWTQKAVRAIKSFYGEPEEDDVVTKELTEEIVKEVPPESLDAPVETIMAEPEAEPEAAEEASEPESIEKSTCPECGKDRDAEGCSNGYHSAEKSVEVDDSGGQESAQENPETAPIDTAEADTPEEKAASVPTEDVRELVGHVQRLVKEIEGLRSENERLVAENERLGKLNQFYGEEVGLAKEVISKVMETPLRPKTAAYVTGFTDVHKLFDPDIAAYLSKRGD